MYRSFTRSLLKPLNLQAAMYALINQLTLVCNMQLNVLDLAEAMKALDGKKISCCCPAPKKDLENLQKKIMPIHQPRFATSAGASNLEWSLGVKTSSLMMTPRVFHCSQSLPWQVSNQQRCKSSSGPVNLQRVCEKHPSLERKSCKRLTTSFLAQHCQQRWSKMQMSRVT